MRFVVLLMLVGSVEVMTFVVFLRVVRCSGINGVVRFLEFKGVSVIVGSIEVVRVVVLLRVVRGCGNYCGCKIC